MATPGQDNFDNKNSVEQNWNNNENKDKNWIQRQWESFKNLIDLKKNKIEAETAFQSNELQKQAVDQALDDLQANVEKWLDIQESSDSAKTELEDFFKKWKEEYENNDNMANDFVNNYKTLKNRNKDIAQSIKNSANYVQLEIDSWDSEPNYVAKSLLRIVKWIMNTEK